MLHDVHDESLKNVMRFIKIYRYTLNLNIRTCKFRIKSEIRSFFCCCKVSLDVENIHKSQRERGKVFTFFRLIFDVFHVLKFR